MIKKIIGTLAVIFSFLSPLYAWTDHALIAYGALRNDDHYSRPIACEPIDHFLTKESAQIGVTLDECETWGKTRLKNYPLIPEALRFSTSKESNILTKFVKALRINPSMRFPLYKHPFPGKKTSGRIIPFSSVSVLKTDYINVPLQALFPGEKIEPREAIATACDEPDYGFDLFLWEDNGTAAGKEYRWGKQPFGNPAIEYATQAPFHMSFRHESMVILAIAPYLKTTYPEYRIHQYTLLSKLAFKTGHPYWGYRFAGLALHYLQDMANPYHTTLVPGASSVKIIFASLLDLLGFHGMRTKLLKEVSDYHILIEKIQHQKLLSLLLSNDTSDRMLAALMDYSKDNAYPPYEESQVWDLIPTKSHDHAERTKRVLSKAVSNYEKFDKIQELDAGGPYDVNQIISGASKEARDNLDTLLADLMRSAGIHTRAYLKSILKKVH